MSDEILTYFASTDWNFANGDETAYPLVAQGVSTAGKSKKIVKYQDLLSGIEFRIPGYNRGEPFHLGDDNWSYKEQEILGNFLGRLSGESYARGGFFASALAVNARGEPGDGLRKLALQCGALKANDSNAFLDFWVVEMKKAHAWYSENDW